MGSNNEVEGAIDDVAGLVGDGINGGSDEAPLGDMTAWAFLGPPGSGAGRRLRGACRRCESAARAQAETGCR